MTPVQAKSLLAGSRCEMLLRQSPGCAWLLRCDLTMEAVYGDSARMLGRSIVDLEGRNFGDLFAPLLRPAWAARVERVFAGDTITAAARFAGSAPEYAITLFPVVWPEGGIGFAAGMAHEAPERGVALSAVRLLDAERTRLYRFLHDHVGQELCAAGLQLDLLRMNLAEGGSATAAASAAAVQTTLESIISAVRGFHAEWNPAAAEDLGLRAALDMLAGSLRANFQGNIRVWADATVKPPPHAAAALYRIAQEAAGNAVRHAGCTVIEILLKSLRTGPALEIRDNGRGFRVASALQERGMGLVLMRYHADQAGIELRIDSAPGKGTAIQAIWRQADGRLGGS
ncbi:MAG: ATP-binding protein [Bryobacteraceae bacterium]|jgi:signal transduction histidine kinase